MPCFYWKYPKYPTIGILFILILIYHYRGLCSTKYWSHKNMFLDMEGYTSDILFNEKKNDSVFQSQTWKGYTLKWYWWFSWGNWIMGIFYFCFLLPVFDTMNMYFIYNKMLLDMYSSGSWSRRGITWVDRNELQLYPRA